MRAWIFWLSLAVIFYTYIGYPVLLWLAAKLFRKKVDKGPYEATVSIILSAFNEEKAIEKKLANLLEMDYPAEQAEILVGSDGASDMTDQIVSKFESRRIRFFRFVKNLGKPHVLNALVREAHGQIIIFTDTRQEIDPHSIRELIDNFRDPRVGSVSGELIFKGLEDHRIAKGMDAYWHYEKFLRKKESQLYSMLGATGAIYAIRRHLYTPMPTDILVDDMFIPLSIIAKGYRAIFDPRARAYDKPSAKGKQEFRRKVRTLAGNYQIFQYFKFLFNPFRSPVACQFFSHKFLRLMVPFFLASVFLANLLLIRRPFYLLTFFLQLLFYGLAYVEGARETLHVGQRKKETETRKKGIGYIPYTFCLLNYSAFIALVQFLKKRQKVTWGKAPLGEGI